MRNKRFLSTVVATALVASTMAMPVMAAGQSGSVDVDVTTKTGVLRVIVPTSMAVAVDQFEITHQGAQIASGTFDMVNQSEMDVKVDVTSTVTLGTGISLAASKEAPTGDEAWLAVAAMTAANSYDIASTTDKTEAAWDLTEANENVATFATVTGESSSSNEASQTFYLAKSAGAAEYKLALADTDGKVSQAPYAQFYKLTAENVTSQDELDALVAEKDVYYVATEADDAVLTKTDKGGTASYAAGSYYSADSTASEPEANGKYVYAAMDADGGKAAFTYVGKLSNDKAEWTDDDIQTINIAYNITGVTGTNYEAVKDDCTYGLYKEAAKGPQVSVNADGVVTMTNLDGTKFASMVVTEGGQDYTIANNDVEGTWNWTDDDVDTVKTFTFNNAWDGCTVVVTINLTDGDPLVSNSVTLSL